MVAAAAPEHRVTAPPVPYAGIATRGVALAIDAALSQLLFVTGAALLGLVGSLVGHIRPDWIVPILVGAGWILTGAAYFAGFWAVTGQTPGMRLMHVRVVTRDGTPPRPLRALVRLVGLVLAIVPLFAGFLPVLVDNRRRGLPDFLARTVVVYADRDLPVVWPEPVTAPGPEPESALVEGDMSGQPG